MSYKVILLNGQHHYLPIYHVGDKVKTLEGYKGIIQKNNEGSYVVEVLFENYPNVLIGSKRTLDKLIPIGATAKRFQQKPKRCSSCAKKLQENVNNPYDLWCKTCGYKEYNRYQSSLGRILRKYRKQAGVKKIQLSERVGIPKKQITAYENFERYLPENMYVKLVKIIDELREQ